MESNPLAIFGIVGALLYVFAVIYGAAARSDYSHRKDTISSLTSPGAPNKLKLDILFSIYNILIVLFGIGLLQSEVADAELNVAGLLIALTGLFGIGTAFFPQDVMGTRATTKGKIHIILAGIISPLTMVSMLLVAIYFADFSVSNNQYFLSIKYLS